MRWLRLWTDCLDSKKIQRLSPVIFKAWVNLLLSTARAGSPNGDLPALDDLVFDFRETPETVKGWLEAIAAAGLVDRAEGWYRVHDWKHWQPSEASNAARQAKFRESRRNAPSNAPSNGHSNGHSNGCVTPKVTPIEGRRQKAEGREQKSEGSSPPNPPSGRTAAEPLPVEIEPPEFPEADGMFMVMPGEHPMDEIDAREIWGDIWRAWKNPKLCFKFFEHQQWVTKAGWLHAIKTVIERGTRPSSIKLLETIGVDMDINGVKPDQPVQRGTIGSVPYVPTYMQQQSDGGKRYGIISGP